MRSRYFLWAFAITAICTLLNRNLDGWPWLDYLLMPGAVPWLLAYAWRRTQGAPRNLQVAFLGGIALCIVTDVFSLFAKDSRFIFGVIIVGYSIVNLFYSAAFVFEVRAYRKPLAFGSLWWSAPFAAALWWLVMQLLWPGISGLRMLVFFFCLTFAVLFVFALARWHAVSDASFFGVTIGCLLLCLSAFIGAVVSFIVPLPFGILFNNITYFAAQFYIITGVVQQVSLMRKSSHPSSAS
jgi:hypothetical protein